MLAVLRQRNFALAWVAGLISLTGDWLLAIGLPLFAYQLTGSALATAAAMAARFIPRLALGSVAGIFVDRWDRRRTMVTSNLLLGLAVLPLLFIRSAEWLWVAYLASAIESALAQFLGPAEHALLPRLVDEADLVPANALNGLNDNLSRLVGPPLGGLVMAAWSLPGAGLLDAASFFVAASLVALIRVDSRVARAERELSHGPGGKAGVGGAFAIAWAEWRAGMALVRRVRPVAMLFLFYALTQFGEGALGTLFVPFITTVLGGDGVAYGTILAAQAVGGLLGNVAIGHLGRAIPPGWLIVAGALGLAAIDALIFNAHHVIPGVVPPVILMVVVGLPAAALGIGCTTLLQTAVADAYRGRVFGAYGTTNSLTLLGGVGLTAALSRSLDIALLVNIQVVAYALGGTLVLLMLRAERPAATRAGCDRP